MPLFRIKTTTNAGARRRAAHGKIVVTLEARVPAKATAHVAARTRCAAADARNAPGAAPVLRQGANDVDVCSSIFEICRRCQDQHLDRLGATCMFDVDGGRAPAWMIEALRSVIVTMIVDIASTLSPQTPGAAIGVTLRQSGGFWALAIAENTSGVKGPARASRRLAMVRALTDRIECVCRAVPNPNGSTIAIAFPIAVPARSGGRVLH